MSPEPSIATEELHTDLCLFLDGTTPFIGLPFVILSAEADLTGREYECTVIHRNGTRLELRCSASSLLAMAASNYASKHVTRKPKSALCVRSVPCGEHTCDHSKSEDTATTTEPDAQMSMDGFAE